MKDKLIIFKEIVRNCVAEYPLFGSFALSQPMFKGSCAPKKLRCGKVQGPEGKIIKRAEIIWDLCLQKKTSLLLPTVTGKGNFGDLTSTPGPRKQFCHKGNFERGKNSQPTPGSAPFSKEKQKSNVLTSSLLPNKAEWLSCLGKLIYWYF